MRKKTWERRKCKPQQQKNKTPLAAKPSKNSNHGGWQKVY